MLQILFIFMIASLFRFELENFLFYRNFLLFLNPLSDLFYALVELIFVASSSFFSHFHFCQSAKKMRMLRLVEANRFCVGIVAFRADFLSDWLEF